MQLAQRTTVDEIPLFHPVGLRNLIEIHLGVDNNYKSLFQRDVVDLRQNKNIYWNLIFFFKMMDLPVDFIKPYEETPKLSVCIQKEISKQRMTQLVRRYGYGQIEPEEEEDKEM